MRGRDETETSVFVDGRQRRFYVLSFSCSAPLHLSTLSHNSPVRFLLRFYGRQYVLWLSSRSWHPLPKVSLRKDAEGTKHENDKAMRQTRLFLREPCVTASRTQASAPLVESVRRRKHRDPDKKPRLDGRQNTSISTHSPNLPHFCFHIRLFAFQTKILIHACSVDRGGGARRDR